MFSTPTIPCTSQSPDAPRKASHSRDSVDGEPTAKRLCFEKKEGEDNIDTGTQAPEKNKEDLEKTVADLFNHDYGLASLAKKYNSEKINNFAQLMKWTLEHGDCADIQEVLNCKYMPQMVDLLRDQHSLIALLQKENNELSQENNELSQELNDVEVMHEKERWMPEERTMAWQEQMGDLQDDFRDAKRLFLDRGNCASKAANTVVNKCRKWCKDHSLKRSRDSTQQWLKQLAGDDELRETVENMQKQVQNVVRYMFWQQICKEKRIGRPGTLKQIRDMVAKGLCELFTKQLNDLRDILTCGDGACVDFCDQNVIRALGNGLTGKERSIMAKWD